MTLLSPTLLIDLIQRDRSIQNAMAVLNSTCQDLLADRPYQSQKISINDLQIAKQLFASGLVKSKVNFNDYGSVHQFVVKNDHFLDSTAKNWLLAPFE